MERPKAAPWAAGSTELYGWLLKAPQATFSQ